LIALTTGKIVALDAIGIIAGCDFGYASCKTVADVARARW
jgi:hypothetical protein